jgi:predicted dienelactone hydrolase
MPARRSVLAQTFAALLLSRSAGAASGRVSKEQRDMFNRLMVRGPFAVKTANPLTFALPNQKRDLLLRVVYPDPEAASESFPLVVFSHGGQSSKDGYNAIAEHWASHGIVTILPTHLDSDSLKYKTGEIITEQLLQARIDDLTAILDHAEDIAADAPGLGGMIDVDQIAVAGHGFGSLPALVLGGLSYKLADGSLKNAHDKRVKALVAYNGIGPLPLLGDDWSKIKLPVLAASGTSDPGAVSARALEPWRWRMSPYSLTSGKSRYGVSITSGDHSYGGLIFRQEPTDKPDATGLAIVNALSTVFLTAQLTDDQDAEYFLRTVNLSAVTDGRAFLERA